MSKLVGSTTVVCQYAICIVAERSWQFLSLFTFYHGLHSGRAEVSCCNSTQQSSRMAESRIPPRVLFRIILAVPEWTQDSRS